jgi:hypothetical protein
MQLRMSFLVKRPGRKGSRLLLKRPRMQAMLCKQEVAVEVAVEEEGDALTRIPTGSKLPRARDAGKRGTYPLSAKPLSRRKSPLRRDRPHNNPPPVARVTLAPVTTPEMATYTCCTDHLMDLLLQPIRRLHYSQLKVQFRTIPPQEAKLLTP